MLALALKYARVSKESQDQLQEYHAFTVHSIRNELLPVQAAQTVLLELTKDASAKDRPLNSADLEQPLRFLRLGNEGVSFYLNHLLKFLRAEIDTQRMQPVLVKELVENEVWLLGEVASDHLRTSFDAGHCAKVTVKADTDFLSAAVKETLRNARTAIYRRRSAEKRERTPPRMGNVQVALSYADPDDCVDERHVCIAVMDDGDASVNVDARKRLEAAWSNVHEKKADGRTYQKGLLFIDWVVRKHGGYVRLNITEEHTVLYLHLPTTQAELS